MLQAQRGTLGVDEIILTRALSSPDPVIKGLNKIRAFLGPFLRKDPLTVPFTFRTEIKNVIAGEAGVAIERHDVFDFGALHLSVPVTAIMTAYPRK